MAMAGSMVWAEEGVTPTTNQTTTTGGDVSLPSKDAKDAKSTEGAKPAPKVKKETTTWDLLKAGGTIGWVIVALSIALVAITVELAIHIRPTKLIPIESTEQIQNLLKAKDTAQVTEFCGKDKSIISKVVGAGMAHLKTGYDDMISAMQEEGQRQAAILYRRIDWIALISNIAPMLGLLGTVVGMIEAFQTIASSEGFAKPAELAEGIYKALVTTVLGLVVAIPGMCVYAYFQGQIERLVTHAAVISEQLVRPFKQLR